MRDFFYHFQITVFAFAVTLVMAKTFHYAVTIRRKNVINWFYFNFYSVVNSQTEESERAKRLQNKFTMSIVLLTLLMVSSIFITRVLEIYFPGLLS